MAKLPSGLSRVNVVGASGSGKSTFARRLASLLGTPYVEMDQLFWEPGWVEPPDHVFFPRLERALAERPSWVLDGNYHRTQSIKWRDAEAVIWLDYSFVRVMAQSVRRAVSRAFTQRELWPGTGNRESFSMLFSRESIVLYTYRTHPQHRARYAAIMREHPPGTPTFIRLGSPREAERFLRSLASRRRPAQAVSFTSSGSS